MTFIALQSATQGQTSSGSSPSQAPVNERARIGFIAGTFTTVTSIPPMPSMPKGTTAEGTTVISWTLDSLFLSIEEQSSLFGHYKAHGMLGFDSQTHQFVLSMFNNFGDHPTYNGNFVGNTLVLQTKVAAPRGAFDQQLRWYRDGESVRIKVLNDFGKGFLPTLEQTATPASDTPK